MRKLIGMMFISIILVGCSNSFEKYVELGDQAFTNSKFDVARTNYQLALEKQPDADELQDKIDFMDEHLLLLDLIADYDYEAAIDLFGSLLDSKYISEVPGKKDNLLELEEMVHSRLAYKTELKSDIERVAELIDHEQLEEAEEAFESLHHEFVDRYFPGKDEELKQQLKELRKKASLVKSEQAPADADYSAYSKWMEHKEANQAIVSKMQIIDGKLIVWGALHMTDYENDEEVYLEDRRRVFTLADDVNLGLEAFGNKDEQIKYFNESNHEIQAKAIFIRVENNEVTSVGLAE